LYAAKLLPVYADTHTEGSIINQTAG